MLLFSIDILAFCHASFIDMLKPVSLQGFAPLRNFGPETVRDFIFISSRQSVYKFADFFFILQ